MLGVLGDLRRFEGRGLLVRGGACWTDTVGHPSHGRARTAAKPGCSILQTASGPPGGKVIGSCDLVHASMPHAPST
jgi:hypothetical protein